MQKSTIYCAIAGMLLLCGGCSKMKDDIDTLKKPIPTALVILNPEYIVQNGKTFNIPFRVNPSNFVVTKENLSLDVPASHITRSSYGTSIPEYELTDVQPHKDAQGGTIDGEWIATVSVKSGAYYSSSLIALVLKYEDANGQQVQITSTYLGDLTTTVKLTPDMVAMKLFPACSYAKLDGSAYLYTPVTLQARPISSGSETMFDLSTVRVDSCKVDAPDEIRGMFWLETTDPDKREWKLQPSYVFQFPDADARSRGIDVKMWLTDLVSGEQITITKPIAFFRTEYTTHTVEFKLSEWPANNTIQVPFGNALAQIGVTADLFKQLSDTDPIPVSKSIGTKVTDDWDGKDGTPAIISLENPHQKEAGNKAVTTPEEDYLKFVFYAGKPDAGKKYKLKLIVTYTVPGADQPTINATIYVPFTFVP